MTSILSRLLEAGLVRVGDKIAFTFKRHKFAATITEGGIIGQCTWNNNAIQQSGFKTLTEWCDTCIQELIHEYVTRFSSWKRVRHVPTQRSFTQLREDLPPQGSPAPRCQCAEVRAQQRKVTLLEQQIMRLQQELQRPKGKEVIAEDNPFKLKF